MDVKKSITIFILASTFLLIVFTFLFENKNVNFKSSQNKLGLEYEKNNIKKNTYTKEQKEFIELFQSSFENR